MLRSVAVLLALSFGFGTAAAESLRFGRTLLWATVEICVASKRAFGLGLPCLAVDLGGPDRPGFAIVPVPGSPTHLLVTPIARIAGLEAPRLRGVEGVALTQAALAARARVVAAAGGVSLEDVGVAVNSAQSRSQDELHFHISCLAASTRAALAGAKLTSEWRWLPGPIRGRRYQARAIAADRLETFNPFDALAQRAGAPERLRQASFALAPMAGGGFAMLADTQPQAMAEATLDPACRSRAQPT